MGLTIKMLDYFKFLLKSTNRHGVHSPFVFKYLTECLYKKPKLSKNKTEDVLLKSITYFRCKSLEINGNTKLLKRLVSQNSFPTAIGTRDQEPPFDLVYFKTPSKAKIEPEKLHNDSFILIEAIRNSKTDFSIWQGFISSPTISVSIDFYDCGVLFTRKEQEKEHFILRI